MAGPYKAVSAAEKYAELEARGEDRPRCECHDSERAWAKSSRYCAGGCWTCAVGHRNRVARRHMELRADEQYRATRAISARRRHRRVKADPVLLEQKRAYDRDWCRLNK